MLLKLVILMATFSITISNQMRALGGSPTTKWGTATFGVALWGNTEDYNLIVYKNLTEAITPSDSTYKNYTKYLSETMAVTADMGSEELQDGSGYNYVFTRPTTEAESRELTSWTSAIPDSESWTSAALGSTTWS